MSYLWRSGAGPSTCRMAMVDGMLLVAGETIATDRLTENLDVKDRDPARSQLAAWYAKSGGGTQSLCVV